MGKFQTGAGTLSAGETFSVSFHRTLRVPDDGKVYPLPPSLGTLPLHKVSAYERRAPAHWDRQRGYFLPLYQREALWLSFDGPYWKPTALKVGVGQVSAITGEAWNDELHAAPQDYLVCPNQPWLDGFKTEAGIVRQFVAVPLGEGYSVTEQLSDSGEGELRLLVIEPRPGRFPDKPPADKAPIGVAYSASVTAPAVQEMGLAAGGKIEQKIYPDPYGLDTWDPARSALLSLYMVNSVDYELITGEPPPPTPIDADLYTRYGLPWFKLYDEERGDIEVSQSLGDVRPIQEIDRAAGKEKDPADTSIEIEPEQVKEVRPEPRRKRSPRKAKSRSKPT